MFKTKKSFFLWIIDNCELVYQRKFDTDRGPYKILVYQSRKDNIYYLVKSKNGKVVEGHNLTSSSKEQIFRNVFVNGEETTYFMITRVHRGDSSYLKILIEVDNQGVSKYDVVPLM